MGRDELGPGLGGCYSLHHSLSSVLEYTVFKISGKFEPLKAIQGPSGEEAPGLCQGGMRMDALVPGGKCQSPDHAENLFTCSLAISIFREMYFQSLHAFNCHWVVSSL